MAIELSDEARAEQILAIKQYFFDEREEDIGDLQAGFFLDFVLEAVGPAIYNQAIKDSHSALQRMIAEFDTTLYVPEDGYRRFGQKRK